MRHVTRLALAALVVITTGGCFVFEEVDSASNMLGKDKSHQPPAKAADAKPDGKGTAVAAAGNAAQGVVATGKAWWATATTLGSEESNPEIAGCKVGGHSEFMLRDDCLARGGVPE